MRRPLLVALWCVDRKRDSTAVFTNMFSWVNTGRRDKASLQTAFQPVSPERRWGKIFWIHNIWGALLTGCQRRVCLRCMAVCLRQFEEKKKPKRWATARFVSCQFHKLSLTAVLTSKKPCFGPFLWQIVKCSLSIKAFELDFVLSPSVMISLQIQRWKACRETKRQKTKEQTQHLSQKPWKEKFTQNKNKIRIKL